MLAGDEQGAHVHGIAKMNLAVDGSALLIELDSPAANIIGFEHPPRTEEEHKAVARGEQLLIDAERLFVPSPAAECRLTKADVRLELGAPEMADRAEAETHHRDGQAHDRDHHQHHDDHRHDAAHDPDGTIHADAHGDYAFDCARPADLTELDVRLFETLPGIERLRVQVISAGGQSGTELTPDDHLLAL
ncbi:MAG: DUF2796 domain-containing protein [Thiohalocapsa sp.]